MLIILLYQIIAVTSAVNSLSALSFASPYGTSLQAQLSYASAAFDNDAYTGYSSAYASGYIDVDYVRLEYAVAPPPPPINTIWMIPSF